MTSCHTRIMQKGCDTADPVDAGRGKPDRVTSDAGADSASMMPSLEQIDRFLTERFGPVADLVTLQAGGWSSAYGFVADATEWVLRVGHHRDDFAKECVAATWQQPGLPVPEVLETGDAFGCHYIVTRRHHGTKLADLETARVPAAIERLVEVLAAIRRVELPGDGYGIWLAPEADAPAASWPEYLCSVADRDEERLVGWRGKLARHPRGSDAFRVGCSRLQAAADAFPTARRLVHADLLLNHLIGPDGSITAVFDWGNALAGDPLYDIAWIVYCIPWFPAIDRRHVLELARLRFPDDDLDRLLPLYELHIALGELQYAAFREDVAGMDGATDRLECLLAGGERR